MACPIGGDRLDVKDYLSQVRKLDLQIKNKLIEQQLWKDIALGITANMNGERVQSSGSQSKMADAIVKIVDAEAEVNALVDRLIDTKKEVIQTIEQLTSPLQYDVLHLHYIQFMTLQAIADKYGMSYDWAKQAHKRAVKNVQRIRDKK